MNTLDKIAAAAQCMHGLRGAGIDVREVRDRNEIQVAISEIGKDYVTPMLSPGRNAFTDDGFWLIGYRDGRPVMAGGARSERLAGRDASDYLTHLCHASYGADWSGSVSLLPVVNEKLHGDLAYFGDLYVSNTFRGGRSALRFFTALGHILVAEKWSPNFTYCFIRERDVIRGAHILYGFTDTIQRPISWTNPPAPRSNSEWIAVLPRSNLSGLVRTIYEIEN